jgi:hypothetical protein
MECNLMAKLSRDLSAGNLHPRENVFSSGVLAALNAEVLVEADGSNTVSLDLRGTFVGTVVLEGTVDGINYVVLPLRAQASPLYVVTATVSGVYQAPCAGFRRLRARMSAFTSGSAVTTLVASTSILDDRMIGESYNLAAVNAGIAGAAVTLTIPAPSAGLRQYVGSIRIERHAAALLTAGASPILVTSTNLPSTPSFSIPVEAAEPGAVYEKIVDLNRALAATAQATAVTVVAPATTGVIWRMTAYYYLAP